MPSNSVDSKKDGAVEKQAMTDIVAPHQHDVLCGRGGGTNNHVGNELFRHMVNSKKRAYLNSCKRDKPSVSRSIVAAIRGLDPPGRFLQRDETTGLWYDIGDQKAREKTSQALREGAPEIRKELGFREWPDDGGNKGSKAPPGSVGMNASMISAVHPGQAAALAAQSGGAGGAGPSVATAAQAHGFPSHISPEAAKVLMQFLQAQQAKGGGGSATGGGGSPPAVPPGMAGASQVPATVPSSLVEDDHQQQAAAAHMQQAPGGSDMYHAAAAQQHAMSHIHHAATPSDVGGMVAKLKQQQHGMGGGGSGGAVPGPTILQRHISAPANLAHHLEVGGGGTAGVGSFLPPEQQRLVSSPQRVCPPPGASTSTSASMAQQQQKKRIRIATEEIRQQGLSPQLSSTVCKPIEKPVISKKLNTVEEELGIETSRSLDIDVINRLRLSENVAQCFRRGAFEDVKEVQSQMVLFQNLGILGVNVDRINHAVANGISLDKLIDEAMKEEEECEEALLMIKETRFNGEISAESGEREAAASETSSKEEKAMQLPIGNKLNGEAKDDEVKDSQESERTISKDGSRDGDDNKPGNFKVGVPIENDANKEGVSVQCKNDDDDPMKSSQPSAMKRKLQNTDVCYDAALPDKDCAFPKSRVDAALRRMGVVLE